MATTATPGFTHITIPHADDAPGDYRTDITYKIPQATADALTAMKTKPTGSNLDSWVQDHGGVLDDGNGHAAIVTTFKDGTVSSDHYKDGNLTTSNTTLSAQAKKNDNAIGTFLVAVASMGMVIPDGNTAPRSKFGTTSATAAQAQTQTAAAPTKAAPVKPPKPQ